MKPLSIAAALSCLSGAAFAGPAGEWRIADGTAHVAIENCGGNLCGHVSWSKGQGDRDLGNLVGRPVIIGMKPHGGVWTGSIVNARDGQKYVGRISLHGERTLKVEGCVAGGLICGGQEWSRLK
ncbi:DUF2147 domain-containing protein [Methylocapsa aurea]|uniref:DUF2147 domain-containing protein n=1 Tax=Methylocapsa aurea TaxID=663610 RepID=UPI00056456F1|nr:DUF2147 domain-containing protein [Methylocapsa aurea]